MEKEIYQIWLVKCFIFDDLLLNMIFWVIYDEYCGGTFVPDVCVHQSYSTVTLFARLRGWSTSVPFSTAT